VTLAKQPELMLERPQRSGIIRGLQTRGKVMDMSHARKPVHVEPEVGAAKAGSPTTISIVAKSSKSGRASAALPQAQDRSLACLRFATR
jgi:hypothetical protein